jgi:hypothetical protein
MVLIFTRELTNRIRYIFHLFFHDLLEIDFTLVSDADQFLAYMGPKFSYGHQPLADEFFVQAADLLFEKGIVTHEPECADRGGAKVLYPVKDPASAFPFDLFAAGFYLVTRFEEYSSTHRDQHGRFIPFQSIAYRSGFLDKPVVNRWALEFADVLRQVFPDLQIPGKNFTFTPTIDIDSAYAYRYKGTLRNLGGYFRALAHGDFKEVNERFRVLIGRIRDPFDTYEYISSIHKKYGIDPVYFILLGDYGPNDKNLAFTHPHFRDLIKKLAINNEVGIHPSYASHDSPAMLKTEISRLADIINRKVTFSRQHFLRVTLPQTYRNLISTGILHEFSIGYAQEPGFRAGICTPFLFYDLSEDQPTHLRIHPFAVMDGTLRDYKNCTPQQAISIITDLIREVKAVNGTFISIWHNESLSDQKRWEGWRAVYQQMIHFAVND